MTSPSLQTTSSPVIFALASGALRLGLEITPLVLAYVGLAALPLCALIMLLDRWASGTLTRQSNALARQSARLGKHMDELLGDADDLINRTARVS